MKILLRFGYVAKEEIFSKMKTYLSDNMHLEKFIPKKLKFQGLLAKKIFFSE
jgi:hypothetical protein